MNDFDTPKKSTVSANPDDVRNLLHGFDKPLEVIGDNNDFNTPEPSTEKIDKTTHYVRGPKKGQPKEKGSSTVRVSSKSSESDGNISGSVITAGLFLLIIDTVLPMVIVLLNNRFSEKKMKAEVLKLTDEQRKELEPLADQVLKQIQMTGNPTAVLLLTFVGLYAANYAMAKANE